MSGDTVLVLGGTGFIGANATRALVERGYGVRVLRRAKSSLAALEGVEKHVALETGDLDDRASLVAAMRGARFVVHAAGHYPVGGLDVAAALRRGVAQMRNVLSAAREAGVERVAYTSSLTTIGPSSRPGRPADERDFYLPGSVASAYCEVKWAMEQEAFHAVARGMDVVVLCPGVVLGEWDVKPTSGTLVTRVANETLPFFVEGTLNVVHARDVADGHVAALERGHSGERYILGGENVRASELFSIVASAAGATPPRIEVSYRAARAASYATEVAAKAGWELGLRLSRVAPGLARRIVRPPLIPLEAVDVIQHSQPLDASKAREELGVPTTPIRQAVEDAYAWFVEHGYVRKGA